MNFNYFQTYFNNGETSQRSKYRIGMTQKYGRKISMQIIYNNEQQLLSSSFYGWVRMFKGIKNYKQKRDLFYKKLLIFNYNYILKKYFNGFVQNNRRLITLHYKKEMANNFRSQRIQALKSALLQVLKDNSYVNCNISKIKYCSLKTYFKLWKQETRKQQLTNQLGSESKQLNDVELWIQQKRQNRIQPRVHQIPEMQIEPIEENNIKNSAAKNNNNQGNESKQKKQEQERFPSISDLNQQLQLLMQEYEQQTKLSDKNINVIKQIKADIKSTLEKIQFLRAQQV